MSEAETCPEAIDLADDLLGLIHDGQAWQLPSLEEAKRDFAQMLSREMAREYERTFRLDCQLIQAKAEVERLREALPLILPLAKGYAAAHPVGSNQKYVEEVEALAAELG